MRPNIENFIGCDSSYRAASIVLYGAPYDSTTSYRPGARFGPAAIRHESYGLKTNNTKPASRPFPRLRAAPPRFWLRASSRCCWAANIWSRWGPCGLR